MIRVAYFPLKKDSDYLADPNELIIDYKETKSYIRSNDNMSSILYPSEKAVNSIAKPLVKDITVTPGNITGSTYSSIYNNMKDVLEWVKSTKGDISNDYTVNNIDDISRILTGIEYGHDILKDIGGKVDKHPSKILSTYNFDDYYMHKLNSVSYGANIYYHDRKQQCEYVPPVITVNGYYDVVNLSISDIAGLEGIEEGANYYVHPEEHQCYLDRFGVVMINDRSGNINIDLSDIGMDKLKNYPMILSSTPKEEINLLSYSSIQGAHNLIKNKIGHSDILRPLINTNMQEVLFTTDNKILVEDDTWYIELKDKRTEGALYYFTGRRFALEQDTSYVWSLKSNREDEVASNKSGDIHVGEQDMIIDVGDGTIARNRNIIIELDNSDDKWTGVSNKVVKFNIRKTARDIHGNTSMEKLGSVIEVAERIGSTFNCTLPNGWYAAELIYNDTNNDFGRGEKHIEYQVDLFQVTTTPDNITRVKIKNRHYIKPDYVNISIKIDSYLKKIEGGNLDINSMSKIEIRTNTGSYITHDTSADPIYYKSANLYDNAREFFEGRITYTDASGNTYTSSEWKVKRDYAKQSRDDEGRYNIEIFIDEIEIGTPYANLMVLLEDPITIMDIGIRVDIKDTVTGIETTHYSNDIMNDNSVQHMSSPDVDDYMIFNFSDIIIDQNKIYYGTIYSGSGSSANKFSNRVVLGTTTNNQFDFTPIKSSNGNIQSKYRHNKNILNMESPSLSSTADGYKRYEDIRIYLKGSPRAIENSKLEIKRSYLDEAKENETLFTEWEDISESRSSRVYSNIRWINGEPNKEGVQYAIRLSGDNINIVEVTDTIDPYTSGGLKVYTMVVEFSVPEPEPEPETPEEISDVNVIVRLRPSTFANIYPLIKSSGSTEWIMGIPVSDNTTQHFYELNERRSVDRYTDYTFNYRPTPGRIIDIAAAIVSGSSYEIIKSDLRGVRADHKGTLTSLVSSVIEFKHPDTVSSFEYNLSNVSNKNRYHDVRFVPSPPDATIEYNLDSKWIKVGSNRRLMLHMNIGKLPVRLSAYGHLSHEETITLGNGGPAISAGVITVYEKNLQISPRNAIHHVKIVFTCPTPGHPKNIPGRYKIFDQGKWREMDSDRVFTLYGEGDRNIEIISKHIVPRHESLVYKRDYVSKWDPSIPGYSASNPYIMYIEVFCTEDNSDKVQSLKESIPEPEPSKKNTNKIKFIYNMKNPEDTPPDSTEFLVEYTFRPPDLFVYEKDKVWGEYESDNARYIALPPVTSEKWKFAEGGTRYTITDNNSPITIFLQEK